MKKITQKYIVCNYIFVLILFVLSVCSSKMAYCESKNDAYFYLLPNTEAVNTVVFEPVEAPTTAMIANDFFDNFENKVRYPYSKDWGGEDSYLLAKIAMAEAESNDIYTKAAVISVVLNRAYSEEFPDSIYDVIFEKSAVGLYQFSPIGNGRWDKVEPNEECYKAIELVEFSQYDFSQGALYFEDCSVNNNWHSRNLQFLFEQDGMRFYK